MATKSSKCWSSTGQLTTVSTHTHTQKKNQLELMKRVVMRSISIQFLSPCCTTTPSRKVPPPAKSHFNPCSRHTSKGAQEFLKGKKLGILQSPCQSPDQPNRLCFSDVKCNIDCRKTHRQQLKTTAANVWQSIMSTGSTPAKDLNPSITKKSLLKLC